MKTIAVIGDVMLDVFSNGSAHRLSPEAPVPILANPVTTSILGGAANTAANVAGLSAGPTSLIGLIGADEAGTTVRGLLADCGIEDLCLATDSARTVVKNRFLSGNQQIMRLDYEDHPSAMADVPGVLEAAIAAIGGSRGVVVSDYGKGAITPALATQVIREARGARLPVVVDSKVLDYSLFRGASVLTPNHLEAQRATGHVDPRRAAREIAEIIGGSAIVTLGPEGMLVHDASGTQTEIASEVIEVADVTGAGDTVTAAVAVALADGAEVVEAARWATRAAAVAVGHAGTYTVGREEVGDAL